MEIWTLSTDLSRDSLLSVLVDLNLAWLPLGSPTGLHSGMSLSMVGESGQPPAELQKVRAALIERGDRASY